MKQQQIDGAADTAGPAMREIPHGNCSRDAMHAHPSFAGVGAAPWKISRDGDQISVEAEGMADTVVSLMSLDPVEMLLAALAVDVLEGRIGAPEAPQRKPLTQEQIVAMVDELIRPVAFNRGVAVQIGIEVARLVERAHGIEEA